LIVLAGRKNRKLEAAVHLGVDVEELAGVAIEGENALRERVGRVVTEVRPRHRVAAVSAIRALGRLAAELENDAVVAGALPRIEGGGHRVAHRREAETRAVAVDEKSHREGVPQQRRPVVLAVEPRDLAAALANDQRLARLALHDAQDRDFAVAVDASTFPTARARIAAADELKRSALRALDPPAPGLHRVRYEKRSDQQRGRHRVFHR